MFVGGFYELYEYGCGVSCIWCCRMLVFVVIRWVVVSFWFWWSLWWYICGWDWLNCNFLMIWWFVKYCFDYCWWFWVVVFWIFWRWKCDYVEYGYYWKWWCIVWGWVFNIKLLLFDILDFDYWFLFCVVWILGEYDCGMGDVKYVVVRGCRYGIREEYFLLIIWNISYWVIYDVIMYIGGCWLCILLKWKVVGVILCVWWVYLWYDGDLGLVWCSWFGWLMVFYVYGWMW